MDVTDENLDTDIVKVVTDGDKALVTALSNGSFRLRCTAKNGKSNTEIVSELEFKVTGMSDI